MKGILILAIMVFVNIQTLAQDVVQWTFRSKKIADKIFEIYIKPIVQEPWHIYSQTSPSEGARPTSFVFNKNPLVTVNGKMKENGKIISKYEDVFGITVKYFEGTVEFVQIVKLKANVKTNITGSIEFMACNDVQCLPPQKVEFNIKLE